MYAVSALGWQVVEFGLQEPGHLLEFASPVFDLRELGLQQQPLLGLTQDEIIAAINAGKLHYRPAAMQGNPWLRLLRREVEDLVRTRHGERYLWERQARTELARVNRELKQLRGQLAALEERRSTLLSNLGEQGSPGAKRPAGSDRN